MLKIIKVFDPVGADEHSLPPRAVCECTLSCPWRKLKHYDATLQEASVQWLTAMHQALVGQPAPELSWVQQSGTFLLPWRARRMLISFRVHIFRFKNVRCFASFFTLCSNLKISRVRSATLVMSKSEIDFYHFVSVSLLAHRKFSFKITKKVLQNYVWRYMFEDVCFKQKC